MNDIDALQSLRALHIRAFYWYRTSLINTILSAKLNDEAKKILDVATHSPTAHIESSGDNSERSFGIKGVLGMGAAARRIVNNKQGGKNQKKRHSFPTFSSGMQRTM